MVDKMNLLTGCGKAGSFVALLLLVGIEPNGADDGTDLVEGTRKPNKVEMGYGEDASSGKGVSCEYRRLSFSYLFVLRRMG